MVCDNNGSLEVLNLAGAQMQCPEFPAEFGNLTQLKSLDMALNSFSGDTLDHVAEV